MAYLTDTALDAALAVLVSNVNVLYICSQEPTTYAQASATYKLGSKTSYTVGSPTDRTPNGRKVVCPAISDGSVSASATATHWALCSGSVLYATGALSASQGVTSGNTFTLGAFDVGIPDAV